MTSSIFCKFNDLAILISNCPIPNTFSSRISFVTDVPLQIIIYSTAVGKIVAIGFTPLNIAITLQNIMACIVFRQLKLGFIAGDYTSNISPTSINIHFTDPTTPTGVDQSGSFSAEIGLGGASFTEESDLPGESRRC